MAVYKVAQDVEADDKLIGPFSFRQFIYLIVVAIAGGLAWGLSQTPVPFLVILPVPIMIFFGALALPLKKDQPMETYLAAILSFHLKPKKRLWVPDGIESLVEITAPKVVEESRVKDFSHDEAEKRLSYLADIVDTRGWAVRGAAMPTTNNAMINDVYYDAQQVPDILDDSGGIAQTLSSMIDQTDARHKQDLVDRILHPEQAPSAPVAVAPVVDTQPIDSAPAATVPVTPAADKTPETAGTEPSMSTDDGLSPVLNPYPTMHQSVIQPTHDEYTLQTAPPQVTSPNTTPTTSEIHVSPDIINLVSNNSLSVETMAREAQRINSRKKLDDGDEVVISLH